MTELAKQSGSGWYNASSARYRYAGKVHALGKNMYESDAFLLIEAKPRNKKASFLRFEWNPNRLNGSDFDYVRSFIDANILQDWFERVAAHGKATRVDIALNIPGIRLDDVLIYKKGTRKLAIYTGDSGVTETIYFNDKKSSQIVAYDLKAEAIAKGKAPAIKPNGPFRKASIGQSLSFKSINDAQSLSRFGVHRHRQRNDSTDRQSYRPVAKYGPASWN
jgi:hypothetical protein